MSTTIVNCVVLSAHALVSQREELLSSVFVVLRHYNGVAFRGDCLSWSSFGLCFPRGFVWLRHGGLRFKVVQMRFMLFMKKSSALLALLCRSLQENRLVLAH
ncbi:hypothetical protein Bca4012_101022 [Brassica carinata]